MARGPREGVVLIAFIVYQAIAALGALIGILYLAIRRPGEIGERLGLGPRRARGGVWIHAASLGEFEAALPLLGPQGLASEPDGILLSCTNATARERIRARLPAGARVRLAPIDLLPCVAGALARERPRLLLFLETEIWPAWILAAAKRGIPMALASGRLSDRSLPRYRLLRGALRPVLSRFKVIGCRTEEDRRRWIAIGAPPDRCRVWGNTKYALGTAPSRPRRGARAARERRLLVGGSLRRGEESILDLLDGGRERRWRLLLAPRHLSSLDRWEDCLLRRGVPAARLSLAGIDPAGSPEGAQALLRRDDRLPPVLLLDRMGLLQPSYRIADAAFVGGTWVPIGGHNLFEAAREGIPVFFGPSTAGVRDAAEALTATGGGRCVEGPHELAAALDALDRDPGGFDSMGEAALRAAVSLCGGAERTLRGLAAAGLLTSSASATPGDLGEAPSSMADEGRSRMAERSRRERGRP
ncbi:MAG: hypothetical protein FJY88_01955 [Candidatus Eisenbacteria bacterium]|nr:hypothetical protein [Candidatus Eisenbacteria bacterium]